MIAKLEPNRVRRTYLGGGRIDAFEGGAPAPAPDALPRPEGEATHALYTNDAYRLYAKVCPVKRLVSVPSPAVSVSDHFAADGKAYVILVNNDLKAFEGSVTVAEGWRIVGVKTDRPDLVKCEDGRLALAPDSGVLLEMTRI